MNIHAEAAALWLMDRFPDLIFNNCTADAPPDKKEDGWWFISTPLRSLTLNKTHDEMVNWALKNGWRPDTKGWTWEEHFFDISPDKEFIAYDDAIYRRVGEV